MFFRKITGRNDLVSNAWQQPISINIYESKVECFDQESGFSFSKPSQQFNKGPPFLVTVTGTQSSVHFPRCSVTSCQYKKI